MILMVIASSVSCEVLDNDPQKHVTDKKDTVDVALDEVAHILSAIPLHTAQLQEVHTAVTSSMGNGYDEEYTQYYGRTYADSPEIDGKIWFRSEKPVPTGSFVQVLVDDIYDGELLGAVVELR